MLAFLDKRGPTTSDQDLQQFVFFTVLNLVLHLSGVVARPELGNSGGRFITPGPGTYGSVQRRVFRQAASSNAFRSKTFADKLKDSGTPGPGSYKQPESFRNRPGVSNDL